MEGGFPDSRYRDSRVFSTYFKFLIYLLNTFREYIKLPIHLLKLAMWMFIYFKLMFIMFLIVMFILL